LTGERQPMGVISRTFIALVAGGPASLKVAAQALIS
jgi:hypothetical protein